MAMMAMTNSNSSNVRPREAFKDVVIMSWTAPDCPDHDHAERSAEAPASTDGANLKLQGQSLTLTPVGSSGLILPSKPLLVFASIGAMGGECYEHSPRNSQY